MGFATQWKGVNGYMIRDPGTFFSAYDESHGIGYPIAFMLVSFIAVMLPLAIVSTAANITTPGEAAIGLVAFLLLGILFWVLALVEALIAHGIAALLGANGVATTLEAYAFPTVVRYGLWWIPVLNIGLGMYGLYLQIKGIAEFHDISIGRAVIAAVVPLFMYIPVVVVLGAVLATFFLDLGSTTGTQPAIVLVESLS